ncbi:MAG: asparagine synthase-related protein [Candidatus Omnitrophota bacterium]
MQIVNEDTAGTLKKKVINAVEKNKADGILFSGGLDTSIIAGIIPASKGINISLEEFNTDIPYAVQVAAHCNLDVRYETISIKQAMEVIPKLCKIMESFDPGLPNDITVYFGLQYAKSMGWKSIMTGDAADELFAGYSYMRDMPDLEEYLICLSKKMFFNSNILGDFFGIEIKQPFLDKEVVECALSIARDLKIQERDGVMHGKWILRKAFEDMLPKGIAWQSKRPLEFGSGTTHLREIISGMVTDEEFTQKQQKYPVKFYNREHMYYYEQYMKVIGSIPQAGEDQKKCPGCGTGLNLDAIHCKICGWC